MKKGSRVLSAVVAAALTAAIVTGVPALPGGTAQAVTQADIDAMKANLGNISGEIKDLKEQLGSVQDDKAKALEQKNYLDRQIGLLDQQIAQLNEIIAAYDGAIAGKETEIQELQAREEQQFELFCQRVRAMEEQGTVSYLSILFNARDFSELLSNAMMIGEIMDYDNGVIDLLQETRQQVEEAKTDLEAQRAEQEAMRGEQESARADLQARENEAARLVAQIAAQESEYQAAIKELEAEDARIQREMQKAQEALRIQSLGVVSEKGFYWPVPGWYTLTSKFGWRIHPIYGTRRYHNGTDIAAAGGTPIQAAKSGVVTTSQYSSSYGNYVVLTHSDGYQTLYAHMSRRAVSVGDVVTQGQTIGYVGSTGVSTGNHLHLEVWYNGTRTDAESYYPNLNSVFIRRY